MKTTYILQKKGEKHYGRRALILQVVLEAQNATTNNYLKALKV
jgi:hypothetical protein